MLDVGVVEEPLAPTDESFAEAIGDPILSFTLPLAEMSIPFGVAPCCRVTHQPGCKNWVVGSVVGIMATIEYLHTCKHDRDLNYAQSIEQCKKRCTGRCRKRRTEERGNRVEVEGDVLADLESLRAAVQTLAGGMFATAKALNGGVATASFHVWVLDTRLKQMWDAVIKGGQDRIEQALKDGDTMSTEVIARLPMRLIDPDGLKTEELEQALSDLFNNTAFQPVVAYADRVLVMPSEIGHDNEARYIVDTVWPSPDGPVTIR